MVLTRRVSEPLSPPAQVGVIVVAFNSRRHWPRLRAALEAQTMRAWRLVVVDNSTDIAQALNEADMPRDTLLLRPARNLGFAAANNLAVRDLDTPFIALL